MPQLRKDYVKNSFVIISTERGKRPKDFKPEKAKLSPKKNCPFCPQNEHMIPGVIEEVAKNGKWTSRAIWNKYKAAEKKGDRTVKTDNEFYTYSDSYGNHEVIIETPEHGVELEELGTDRVKDVISLMIRRIKANYEQGAEYVSVFKNKGGEAGASLSHAHHQLVSYNIFPEEISKELQAAKKHSSCPYCRIISSEKDSERKIFDSEHFAAFSPYASRFPMEAWILPKRCIHSITELDEKETDSLALLLRKTLKALGKLGSPPYNILYKISSDKNKGFHFRLEIAPRLSKWAGFELATGTIINTISPEDAAKFYRGNIK